MHNSSKLILTLFTNRSSFASTNNLSDFSYIELKWFSLASCSTRRSASDNHRCCPSGCSYAYAPEHFKSRLCRSKWSRGSNHFLGAYIGGNHRKSNTRGHPRNHTDPYGYATCSNGYERSDSHAPSGCARLHTYWNSCGGCRWDTRIVCYVHETQTIGKDLTIEAFSIYRANLSLGRSRKRPSWRT